MQEGVLIASAKDDDEDFSKVIKRREAICAECPLLIPTTGICNPNLYMHPLTLEISKKPQKEYKKGCGCILKSKISKKHASCPISRW